MDAASVLIDLAAALGAFAIGCGLIWLLFRIVERIPVSDEPNGFPGVAMSTLLICANAFFHIGDGGRWNAIGWIALIVISLALCWREWRRQWV